MSSRVTGKPPTTRWRRPMTRTYDYNTALGENYYKPQLDYISTRRGRGRTPPSATTFAERLLKYPPSGRSSSASRRGEESELSAAASSAISSMTAAAAARERERESSMNRYSSLDDLGLDEDMTMRRRRQLLLQASRENLADDRGLSPFSPGVGGGRSRVTFGDKMLDAVGVKESGMSMSSSSTSQQRQQSSLSSSSRAQQLQSSLMTDEEGDAIDKILNDRRNRRQAGMTLAMKSADADLYTEDPLKSPQIMSSRMQNARQQMDDMREEMRKDSDSSTSRFRQRLRAKREQEQREEQDQAMFGSMSGSMSALDDAGAANSFRNAMSSAKSAMSSSKNAFSSASKNASSSTSASSGVKFLSNVSSSAQNLSNWADDDDAETAAILSKVEQIRKRAKARMAALNDDFPDLQIESSLASRRAASRQMAAEDEFDSDYTPSSRLVNSSASSGGNRSVTISKRTIKSSYDLD